MWQLQEEPPNRDQDNDPPSKPDTADTETGSSIWAQGGAIGIGVAIGAAFGVLVDSIALGAAFGLLIGGLIPAIAILRTEQET